MALDLFQTSDTQQFWRVFGTTAAATYVAAGLGLLAIYRKASMDMVRTVVRSVVQCLTPAFWWWLMRPVSIGLDHLRDKLSAFRGKMSNGGSTATRSQRMVSSTTTGEDLAAQAESQHRGPSKMAQEEPTSPIPQLESPESESVQSVARPLRIKSLPTLRRAHAADISASADSLVRAISARTT